MAALDPHHLIDLDDGKFLDPDTGRSRLRASLEAAASKGAPVVIHAHGGLVLASKARDEAAALAKVYRDAGAYPLFVIWRTFLTDVLRQDLKKLNDSRVFRQVLRHIARFVQAKRPASGEKGAATLELPSIKDFPSDPQRLAATLDMLEAEGGTLLGTAKGAAPADRSWELAADEAALFEAELERDLLLREAVLDEAEVELLDDDVRAEVAAAAGADEGAKGLSLKAILALARHATRILKRVLARFAADRDHGPYETIVEEIVAELYIDRVGGHFWQVMKTDAADAVGGPADTHGGAALAAELARLWEADGPDPRVTLVGHSAGAIWMAELLDHADGVLPDGAQVDLVLLAPAATFASWAEKADVLARRVRRLRVFSLSDAAERGYFELPPFRGSLLYAVASLFERAPSDPFDPATADTPLIGMERYFGEGPPYADLGPVAAVREHLGAFGDAIVYAPTPADAPPDRQSTASRHGGSAGPAHDSATQASLARHLQGHWD